MKREDAIPYISFCVDDALNISDIENMTDKQLEGARLIGWQCGFEPMFVAAWSYLGDRIEDSEAEELATDALIERAWFSDEPRPPDYVI